MNVQTQRALRSGHRRAIDPASPDFGPTIRINRGDIIKTEGPCPHDPKVSVRRGRAVCHYDRLHARGGLTDGEYMAADYYAQLLEREAGCRDRPVVPIGRRDPWMQGHPVETQVQAAAKLRTAHEAVGHFGRALLRRFVGENQPVTEIARLMSMNEQQCLGRLRASLTRLAEIWGMEG